MEKRNTPIMQLIADCKELELAAPIQVQFTPEQRAAMRAAIKAFRIEYLEPSLRPEREEIEKAHADALKHGTDSHLCLLPDEYYNQTFKTETD